MTLTEAINDALADWEEILGLYQRGDKGRVEVVGAVLTLRYLRSLTTECPCGCPADMHIGEIGCPCGLPDEPLCANGADL